MHRSRRKRAVVGVGGALAVLLGTLALAGVGNAAPQPDSSVDRATQPVHTRLAKDLASSDYGVRLDATREVLRRGGIAIKEGGRVVGSPIGPASIMTLTPTQVANIALQSGTDQMTNTVATLGQRWAQAKLMTPGKRQPGKVMATYLGDLLKVERKQPNAARAFIPMFLDAMARQRTPGTNLVKGVEPSAVPVNALEEILILVSFERFIPKRKAKTRNRTAGNPAARSFPVNRANKPCSTLLDGVINKSGRDGANWADKKVVKEGFKNNIIKPGLGWGVGKVLGLMYPGEFWADLVKWATKKVLDRILSFLKVAKIAIEIYKTAVALTSTTMTVEAAETSREQPEGIGPPDFSDFTAYAGVDEETARQYMEEIGNLGIRDAISDCMKVVGLPAPFWADQIVDELEKFKVEWELKNPNQDRYNWDSPFTGGGQGNVGEGGTIWDTAPSPLIGLGKLERYSSLPRAQHTAKLRIERQDPWKNKKGMWRQGKVRPSIKARLDTTNFDTDTLLDLGFSLVTEDPFGIAEGLIKMGTATLRNYLGPEAFTSMDVTYHYNCADGDPEAGARSSQGRSTESCSFTPPQTYIGTLRGTESETTDANYSGEIVRGSEERNWSGFLTFSYSDVCPATYVDEVDPAAYFACYDLSQASINFSETSASAVTRDGETVRCEVAGSGTIRESDLEEFDETPLGEGYDELVLHMSGGVFELTEGFEYWSPYVVTESDAPATEDVLTGECSGTGIEPYDVVESFRGLDLYKQPPLQQVPIVLEPGQGQFADLPNWTDDFLDLTRSWRVDKSNPEEGTTFEGDYSWSLQGSGEAPLPANRGLSTGN